MKKGQSKNTVDEGENEELPHMSYITRTCQCAHTLLLVIHEVTIQLITDLELLKIIPACDAVSG